LTIAAEVNNPICKHQSADLKQRYRTVQGTTRLGRKQTELKGKVDALSGLKK
jgi:hypothetical protein